MYSYIEILSWIDFIVEYTGQIRCWFYYMHVMAVALFGRPAFKNCIVHGTLLFDTDMQHMLQAITPTRQKLTKHGVESVRQRITLLKEHTSLSIDEFKRFAIEKLCSDTLRLTEEDVRNIERIEQETYLNPKFIYGKENLPL